MVYMLITRSSALAASSSIKALESSHLLNLWQNVSAIAVLDVITSGNRHTNFRIITCVRDTNVMILLLTIR